jgi:hypothetical protein
MQRLEEYPILRDFLENLLETLSPEWGDSTSILHDYSLGEWSISFSRTDAIARAVSGAVTLSLVPPPAKDAFMDSGFLFNTNHGMFIFARDAARRLCEVEMHFYTRQAPPFFEELMACHPLRESEGIQSMVRDVRIAGVMSTREFMDSLEMRPMNVVAMDD